MELIKDLKPPKELKLICDDIKLCGRKEFSDLLKLKYKYTTEKERKKKDDKDAAKALEPAKEMTTEQLEAMVDKELDDTLSRMERDKKKQAKKLRENELKQDHRKKMSVIAATTFNEDEDLTLDWKTWKRIKAIEPEDLEQYLPAAEENADDLDMQMDPNERKYKYLTDGVEEKADTRQSNINDRVADESFSEDEATARIEKMAEEIDAAIASKNEYKMLKSKRETKKSAKNAQLVDQQRQRKMDESDDEALMNTDLMAGKDHNKKDGSDNEEESENDDDLEQERQKKLYAKIKALKKKGLISDSEDEDGEEKTEKKNEEEEEKQLFLNPLLAFDKEKKVKKNKKKDNDSEEWSDDDKYDPKMTKDEIKQQKEKDRKLLGKRRKAGGLEGDINEVKDFFRNEALEEVP